MLISSGPFLYEQLGQRVMKVQEKRFLFEVSLTSVVSKRIKYVRKKRSSGQLVVVIVCVAREGSYSFSAISRHMVRKGVKL